MASASRWLLLLALAGVPACSDEAPTATPSPDGGAGASTDARPGDGGGSTDGGGDSAASSAPPPIECFMGTPKTHEELLNACWPETVTAVSKKANLPGGYTVGTALPPLPP